MAGVVARSLSATDGDVAARDERWSGARVIADDLDSGRRLPGRPRDPAVGDAILAATLDLLAEFGYGRTSLDAVAERAGVSKPTLYRRWSSKKDLVIAAIERFGDSATLPEGGDARQRVTTFVEEWWNLAASPEQAIVPKVFAELLGEAQRHPELNQAVHRMFLSSRRAQIRHLLGDAVADGELRPDLDLDDAIDVLIGTLLFRRLISDGPVSPEAARRIVDIVFDGAGPVDTEVM